MAALLTVGPSIGVVSATPASFEASFRDLPGSVRAGDLLTVQVDTQTGSTCDGSITYRGGAVQSLASITEIDRRCRWDVTVPSDARRGDAAVSVNLSKEGEQETIEATLYVQSRGDEVEASFRDLPGIARRGEQVAIVLDVSDNASCQGAITYDDGRTQQLDPQRENKQRCRWDVT